MSSIIDIKDSESQDEVISLITIIENEIICDKSLYSFPQDEEREMKFGIVKINTDVLPKLNKTLYFLFSVDCSGSMSDLCNDRRTKNAHIIHTLTNMLLFFSEKENICIYVEIDAFDDKIWPIIKPVLVSPRNVGELIDQLKKIYPKNSTNIELALTNASTRINSAEETIPSCEKYHIFMTDGDITEGNSCEIYLKTLLNLKATNIFIGFGIDHNIKVLSELGGGNDTTSNVNNYYFIDLLENSGLVYGEIIHNILYGSLKNVKLVIINGLIYNWKTNEWTNTLNIGNVIFNTEKVYHIVSDVLTPIISASGNIEGEPFSCTQYTTDTDESLSKSITQYKYRQRTQQLLYLARHFNNYKNYEAIDAMKKKLDDFFTELKTNKDIDSPFMKLLMDDVYITRKMFGTSYNSLYSNARQTSQGTQRCYNVGDNSTIGIKVPRISRHITHHMVDDGAWRRSTHHYNKIYDEEEDAEHKDGLDQLDQLDGLIDGYEISQNVDTPYSTPALLGIMREISAPISHKPYFFKDDDYLTMKHTTA